MPEIPIFSMANATIHIYTVQGGETYVSIASDGGFRMEFLVTGKLTIKDDRKASPKPSAGA